ncbi:hypothetical protein LTR56_018490 [Elasticomyces elasticus]|nr:hypothetical protein LTR56_018490 [Elasticomyces elasticus]KAK3632680.1 hypothetical protein LTR22_020494 [Elasticomyces elasticus]KAK4912220.1 hypothetical protein LTR49_019316 [Elasticomyces elasticus]KAK5769334.1 hypothetical protein LTS12_000261 [Elasticomyces elasticus]
MHSVSLFSATVLLGGATAARLPFQRGGWGGQRQHEAASSQEWDDSHRQHEHRPPPYWGQAPHYPNTPADGTSSVLVSAPTAYSTSSAPNTVNSTSTFVYTNTSSSLSGYAPTSTVTIIESSTVSPIAPYTTSPSTDSSAAPPADSYPTAAPSSSDVPVAPVDYSSSAPSSPGSPDSYSSAPSSPDAPASYPSSAPSSPDSPVSSAPVDGAHTTVVVTDVTTILTTVCPYEETQTSGGLTTTSTADYDVTSTITSSYQTTLTIVETASVSGYPVGPVVTPYPYSNSSASATLSGSAGTVGSTPISPVTVGTSSSIISSSAISSQNATSASSIISSSAISSSAINSQNATSASSTLSTPIVSSNSTSSYLTGTATRPTMAPTTSAVVNSTANTTSSIYCSNLCNVLSLDTEYTTTAISCDAIPAGQQVTLEGGQATAGCGSPAGFFTPSVDICRVTLTVETSGESEAYMEVWLPNNSTDAWNGRTLSTDNGGSNGCVHYVDLEYVTSLGFAAIGDNGGHNSSAFDGGWMYFNNEAILDWVYRARHAATEAGKQVIDQFYGEEHTYSYYMGCSTGGQQGLYSAQHFPDDFDGIIAGSAAADFNHLQAWSGRFVQLTGLNSSDPKFLTIAQWTIVQSYIFDVCDAALDGVDDGIIEDPTICKFDATAIPVCAEGATDNCLTATQIDTVTQVFSELYNSEGELLYPQLLYGSQIDAFKLGQLSGSVQGIAKSWYGGAVYNSSTYDATQMSQADYDQADATDELHGHVSAFSGDLSAFNAAGKKLLMYHGLADPLVSGANSQRYYLKVAKTLGMSNTDLDSFMRYFRISGMAHCGVGGISGAGAWMFGQSGLASAGSDNVIMNMVDWVENGNAPDTITGTKFWYDTPSAGIEFERTHCRFPYRTTYSGSGDWTDPSTWSCAFIDDWQTCAVGATPRLCNADGSFN